MKFEILEARYKSRCGIGCDGGHCDDDVVCKARIDGKDILYFLYSTECGGLYGVSDANLFLKKYDLGKEDPPFIDFFMDGYSTQNEQKLSDSEYYAVFLALKNIASAILI